MKSRWKTLAVALSAATALLALFAVSAQAANLEDGGKAGVFKVAGLSTLVKGATLVGTQEGISTFLIHGKNAFIECAKGTAQDVGISESEFEITFKLEGCVVREDTNPFPLLTACKIKEGTIIEKYIAKAKLHEGNLYILFEGSGAEQLIGTDEYESEECALGLKVKLKGSLVAKVDNGNEAITHLIEFSKAITELFQVVSGGVTKGDILKFGNSQALYTASWILELTGVHKGKTWSVV